MTSRRRYPNVRNEANIVIKVEKVKPGVHGYNIYAKVIESSIQEVTRTDGSILNIAEVLLGDETATIKARIVGEFATILVKDTVVAVRNGRSEVFQEKHRLELDRWGKITSEAGVKIDKVNNEKNLSSILYEKRLVPNK